MKSSTLTITLMALFLFNTGAWAQDTTSRKQSTFYTGFYNQVPENFNFPMLGVINICDGDQHNVQIGFTNLTQKNQTGVQVGFSNITGGKLNGAQTGFVNVCKDSLKGTAVGFVNITGSSTDGAQVGFLNLSRQNLTGAQVGYVNATSSTAEGAQIGFINACKDTFSGMQVGFVNAIGGTADGVQVGFMNGVRRSITGGQVGFVNAAADSLNGVQVGFVNAGAGWVKGTQIGFVNVADSLTGGIPLGFLSFVRKGGFKALEVSHTEMYPVNLAFKTGVDVFYTTFMGSYNPDFKNEFALGAGLGSNIKLSTRFFFNPEAISQVTFERHPQQIVSLNTMFGFNVSRNISLVAGPDVVWINGAYKRDQPLYKPAYSIYYNKIDQHNSLHVGIKASVRIRF